MFSLSLKWHQVFVYVKKLFYLINFLISRYKSPGFGTILFLFMYQLMLIVFLLLLKGKYPQAGPGNTECLCAEQPSDFYFYDLMSGFFAGLHLSRIQIQFLCFKQLVVSGCLDIYFMMLQSGSLMYVLLMYKFILKGQ